MPRYLLTSSLYEGWRFYHAIESKEKQDFLDTLLKKPITDPDSLKNIEAGQKFERFVQEASAQSRNAGPFNSPYTQCVNEVADIVRGGLWQEKVQFDVRLLGMDFLVYGKMDVVKRDTIYDIKRTGKYEAGKYTASIQHAIYMVGAGMKKFDYLVTDEDSVYREPYVLTPTMKSDMFARLAEMVDGILADQEFRNAYLSNWKAYGEAPPIRTINIKATI